MSKALLSDILRAIKHSFSRFISIIIIVALGTGFFVGIKSAGPSMELTAKDYFSDNNLMDIRVQSTIGLTQDDINAIRNISGVKGIMGEKFIDALVLVNGKPEIDIDGSQISTRAYGINLNKLQEYYYGADNPDFINRPTLIEGTYPTANNQCLVDASELSTPDSYKIGSKIKFQPDSKSDLSELAVTEFEIVGIIRSPYYISFERGNSLVGSGKIGTFIYIPETAFVNDYYSEAYITLDSSSLYEDDRDAYNDYVKKIADKIEVLAQERINSRVDTLKAEIPEQIKNAQTAYQNAKNAYDNGIKDAEETIALYQRYVDDPEGAYNEAANAAAEALGIAEEAFNGNSEAYYKAIETYNANLENYKAARQLQEDKYQQLTTAESQYQSAQTALYSAQNAVNSAQQFVTSTQNIINTSSNVLTGLEEWQNGKLSNSQLTDILSTLQSINPDLYSSISALSAVSMATEAIALINPYLEQQKSQLAIYESELEKSQQDLNNYTEKFKTAATFLESAKQAYNASDAQLDAAYEQLSSFYEQLEGSKNQLSMAQIELMINKNAVGNDLDLLKAAIASAPTYLEKAKAEYNSVKANYETKLFEAEKKIEDAKKQYSKLDSAKWMVYDREDTPGYSGFDSAVENINVLANIFPVIFFLVSALVCLTTMTRMVEEERTQMGTMKALGYSTVAISSKYILYALFASVLGTAIGILIGVYALPYAIYSAYSIVYTLPKIKFALPAVYILIGVSISLLTTLVAAVIASAKELKVQPAKLMRPKAPKPGKRVLLERIGFIWKRLNFTSKVTIRNLFRHKARFIMTVIGIGGCTALILGSIGLYSSVNNLMRMQYDENGISDYDVQIVFSGSQKDDSVTMQMLKNDSRITDIMLSSMISVTGGSDRTDKTDDVYLFVPKQSDKISDFIRLNNRLTGEQLTLDDTGAIITEKFATATDTIIGDSIWVELSDGSRVSIPVANITENYTFSYVYLSENLYQYLFQEAVEYNYAIGTVQPNVLNDAESSDNKATKKAMLATDLMAYESINAVAYISDTVDTLNEVIGVLSIVILIFILAAGILAYIVLYNLNNINISERQRELATIKVLGFHDNEVSTYIFRENIILTIMGIILGLFSGILVHKLLITYCSVDTVMFVQTLSWYSYVIAGLLTVIFAVIVNVIMHKKMKKIDMVESLKAIE